MSLVGGSGSIIEKACNDWTVGALDGEEGIDLVQSQQEMRVSSEVAVVINSRFQRLPEFNQSP